MGAAQTCCMKQNWLRAHNCSLDLSRQSYKSQASYALLPVNGWEWQRPKCPFLWVLGTLQWVPLDWEISISLAKLFYFWITKSVFPIQSFFHILSISFTGIKLYNLKVLSLSLSLSFMFPHLLSFTDIFSAYLLEIESHLYICFLNNPNKHKSTVHFRRNHQWN